MGKFLLQRILQSVPVGFGVIFITFILTMIIPGDPVLSMVGERYDEKTVTEMRNRLQIDKPFFIKLKSFIKNVFSADLGKSFVTNRPVLTEIIEKFPNTLILSLGAMTVAIFFGFSFGLLSALRAGTAIDRLIMIFSLAGISLPVFWVALIYMLVFGVYLGLLPPTGYGGIEYLILPAFTLGLRSAAQTSRLIRASMIETLEQDYIRTARSKGLSSWKVLTKHALPNSIIPAITIIGTDFGSYLSGAVLTESIFGWPGIGRYALDAVLNRDFPVIQGTVLFMALVFIFINILTDILYGIIDPKIKAQYSRK